MCSCSAWVPTVSLPKLLSFIVFWVLYISYAFGIGSSIETRNTARNLIRTLLSLLDILVRTAFLPWDRDSPRSSCLPQIHILRIQPPSRCMLPQLPTNYHFNNSALKQKTNVSILQTFNFSHDILYILADKSHTCFGLFCVSLCMHTHVCGMCTGVCICSCMHACMHVCRPKVNVRYPHLSPPTLVFKAGSSIEPDSHHSSSV